MYFLKITTVNGEKRPVYSAPQMPTPKESGLSFVETTLKENPNPQTHMNSSETRKSPVCECVLCGGGGCQTQGDGGERHRDT